MHQVKASWSESAILANPIDEEKGNKQREFCKQLLQIEYKEVEYIKKPNGKGMEGGKEVQIDSRDPTAITMSPSRNLLDHTSVYPGK